MSAISKQFKRLGKEALLATGKGLKSFFSSSDSHPQINNKYEEQTDVQRRYVISIDTLTSNFLLKGKVIGIFLNKENNEVVINTIENKHNNNEQQDIKEDD